MANQNLGPFGVPLDVYPFTARGSRERQFRISYQGLPSFAQSGLVGILESLQSPATFATAFQPTLSETINRTLGNMARRGIISSSLIPETMSRIMQRVPSVWAQSLANLGNLYSILRYATQLGLGGATSWGLQANPLAPYQLRTQQLLGLLPLI